jgi:hypothetical protein
MENKINFSTLNNEVVPDDQFIEEIENYTPKLSEELVKQILEEKGINTSDSRVYRIISILAQSLAEDIISSTANSIVSKKNNNKFLEWKELTECLKEKGINCNRSQFFCDNLNVNLEKSNK